MGVHDGEPWPYHKDVHGNMVPCESNPCTLHGNGGDVMADSVDEAYRITYSTGYSGMSGRSPFDDIPGDSDRRITVEQMLVSYTEEADGISSPSPEGLDGSQGILHRRDGSYMSVAGAKKRLGGDDAYNRYVIGETDGDNGELADHWTDSAWLEERAARALEDEHRRGYSKWETGLYPVDAGS